MLGGHGGHLTIIMHALNALHNLNTCTKALEFIGVIIRIKVHVVLLLIYSYMCGYVYIRVYNIIYYTVNKLDRDKYSELVAHFFVILWHIANMYMAMIYRGCDHKHTIWNLSSAHASSFFVSFTHVRN